MARLLTLDDLDAYVAHSAITSAENGRDGDPISSPYGRNEPFDTDAFRERTVTRWSSNLETFGWRRAWGIHDADSIVASAEVCGGHLTAELHRVMLGIAVQRGFRRSGNATRLLDAVIAWCREQPSIEWLDLGVFGGNVPAQTLFRKTGFEEVSRTVDRWRVDGERIDDIFMTMRV